MIWIMMLIWLFVTSLVAGPQEENFLQGINLYKNSDYQKAKELYEKIDPKNSSVWYNLGNCAYYTNEYATAYICWKKAERNASESLRKEVKKNLSAVNKKLGREEKMSYTFAGLQHQVYTMLKKLPGGLLQILFLLVWYYILALIYSGRKSLLSFWLLCGALISCTILVAIRYRADNLTHGIICKDEVILYAGPNRAYHTIGSIDNLETVEIYQHLGSWYKIGNQSHKGWVPSDSLEPL